MCPFIWYTSGICQDFIPLYGWIFHCVYVPHVYVTHLISSSVHWHWALELFLLCSNWEQFFCEHWCSNSWVPASSSSVYTAGSGARLWFHAAWLAEWRLLCTRVHGLMAQKLETCQSFCLQSQTMWTGCPLTGRLDEHSGTGRLDEHSGSQGWQRRVSGLLESLWPKAAPDASPCHGPQPRGSCHSSLSC